MSNLVHTLMGYSLLQRMTALAGQAAAQLASVRAPTPLSPLSSGSTAAGSVQLVAAAYASRPAGIDYHYASQWQIAADAAFADVLWDSGQTSINLTSVVPGYALAQGQVYWWRVRYRGEVLDWSPWSAPQSFTRISAVAGNYSQINVAGGPSVRYAAGLAWLDGKLWVYGGFSAAALTDLWVFDPSAASWAQKASGTAVGDAVSYPEIGLVALGGKLYALGSSGTNRFARYDPATNAWSVLSSAGLPSGNIYLASLSGKLYCAGNGSNLSIFVYDPASNVWSPIGSAPSGTPQGIACAAGKVFVQKTSGPNDVLAVYDPATAQWSTVTALPARSGVRLIELNGLLYLFGGQKTSGGALLAELWQYDPSNNTWTQLPSGPMAVRKWAALAAGEGYLSIFGGYGASGAKYNDLWKVQ